MTENNSVVIKGHTTSSWFNPAMSKTYNKGFQTSTTKSFHVRSQSCNRFTDLVHHPYIHNKPENPINSFAIRDVVNISRPRSNVLFEALQNQNYQSVICEKPKVLIAHPRRKYEYYKRILSKRDSVNHMDHNSLANSPGDHAVTLTKHTAHRYNNTKKENFKIR